MAADQEVVIWTRLRGVREFLAGIAAEAKAMQGLGAEADRAARKSFLFNQALFTARRLLYGATLALGAAGAAAVFFGFRLNMTMEEAMISFTQFLGSAKLARQELDYLYDFAAKTPFRFEEVVTATRRFLAFGFTLQETNRYMRVIADTAAGLGGNASENISRLVLVFGQMKAAGRVLGNDLLQLAALGINARQMLKEAFNLTPKQMANIGALGIPADLAIEVIMKGLQDDFEGMSEKQARTFRGRLSTLADYTQQFFADLTRPLYNYLRDSIFPQMTSLAQHLSTVMREQGLRGVVAELDRLLGTGGALSGALDKLVYWFQVLKGSINEVLPAVRTFAIIVGTATFAIITLLLATVDLLDRWGLLYPILQIISIALAILAVRFIIVTTWTVLAAIAGLFFGESSIFATIASSGLVVVLNTMITRLMIWITWQSAATFAAYASAVAIWAMNSALFATLVLIAPYVAAAILLVGVIILLIVYWEEFTGIVERFWYILMLSPIGWIVLQFYAWGKAIEFVANNLDRIRQPFKGVGGTAGDILGFKVSDLWGGGIPGLQGGGYVTSGGMTLVGERGPELLRLPSGASVSPMTGGGLKLETQLEAPVTLNVDGRKMAESVARWRIKTAATQ